VNPRNPPGIPGKSWRISGKVGEMQCTRFLARMDDVIGGDSMNKKQMKSLYVLLIGMWSKLKMKMNSSLKYAIARMNQVAILQNSNIVLWTRQNMNPEIILIQDDNGQFKLLVDYMRVQNDQSLPLGKIFEMVATQKITEDLVIELEDIQ